MERNSINRSIVNLGSFMQWKILQLLCYKIIELFTSILKDLDGKQLKKKKTRCNSEIEHATFCIAKE